MVSTGAGGRGGRGDAGAGGGAARAAVAPPDDVGSDDLETVADLTEEQLRVDELRNDLLRELLEDSGAALAGAGGESGGSPGGGGGLPGGSVLTRVGGATGGTGLGLGLGSIGATTAGAAAAGIGIPGIALAGILDDDSNANPGELRDSPGETNVVTPNAEVSQRLERLLESGVDVNLPSWLTPDKKVDVEDPGPVRVDLVEETLEEDSSKDPPGPGGSTPPSQYTGGPDSIVKNEQLIEDTLDAGGDPPGGGSNSGGSPGGSTPLLSEVGGVDRNTSTGAGLVEAVLGDVATTPDGSPGGSTPSRTGRRNEAAERRRQDAPDVDVAVTVDGSDLTEREVERIAEEKAEETGEEIARKMRGTRR